jgi:hypothetical protein
MIHYIVVAHGAALLLLSIISCFTFKKTRPDGLFYYERYCYFSVYRLDCENRLMWWSPSSNWYNSACCFTHVHLSIPERLSLVKQHILFSYFLLMTLLILCLPD